MANEALKFYAARTSELDEDMRPTEKKVSTFATTRFQTVASPQQSKDSASRKPSIVISSSGMATGGRVLHHMAAALPDERNTVLFVGYQADGTRGRQLVDGARDVRIHGQSIAVRARIAKIDSMSAHADRGEILRWLGTLRPWTRLCLVHGEPGPMDGLKTLVSRTPRLDRRDPATPRTPFALIMNDTRRYLLESVDDAAVVQLSPMASPRWTSATRFSCGISILPPSPAATSTTTSVTPTTSTCARCSRRF